MDSLKTRFSRLRAGYVVLGVFNEVKAGSGFSKKLDSGGSGLGAWSGGVERSYCREFSKKLDSRVSGLRVWAWGCLTKLRHRMDSLEN